MYLLLRRDHRKMTPNDSVQPRRNVPKAIRRTFFRILVFYVIGRSPRIASALPGLT